jgi:hypothetical protein
MKASTNVFAVLLALALTLSACDDATPAPARTPGKATATPQQQAPGSAQPQLTATVPPKPGSTATAVAGLADKPYADPNGYFKITPPKAWKIETYPSEPRGKVAFSTTEGSQVVEIRVLVQVTQVTDFQEFVRKLKSNAANLGVQPEWQVMMFADLPAIRSTMTYSAGGTSNKFMNLRFLDGNIYHDIQFASLPALFDKYQDVVSKVVATYEIVKRPSEDPGGATAKQQQAAKYLRLAQVALEMGDKKSAIAYVDEGLKNDPENRELLRLKESLK